MKRNAAYGFFPKPSPNLSGVEYPLRVERLFHGLQGHQAGFAEGLGYVGPLGDADAVLAGERSAHGEGGREDLIDRLMDPLCLFGVREVAEDRRMEVAVAGMTVDRYGKAVCFGDCLLYTSDAADE